MTGLERLYHQMLMSRSGAERVRMGAEMYSAARAIVLSTKPPDQTPEEWILRRFHGSEFSDSEIRSFLENRARRRS